MHDSRLQCLISDRVVRLLTALSLIVYSGLICAGDLRFGLLAKSTSDHNFVDTWMGCQQAAVQDGNQCDLLGDTGPANAHVQKNVLRDALESRSYSAIAVSVTESSYVAATAAQSDIPILTFDSPFAEKDQHLSLGYIGPDNYAFGEQLAGLALNYRPEGGVLCILTVGRDPNLQTRVAAVRQTLAGAEVIEPGLRLSGQSGWQEHERCPAMSLGTAEQVETQFRAILTQIMPDMIISVGHWPVVDVALFRHISRDVKPLLQQEKMRLIVGVGRLSDEYKALVYEGLVHGLVSIDFKEIGRVTYQQLKQAAAGEPVPLVTHTQKVSVMPEMYVNSGP